MKSICQYMNRSESSVLVLIRDYGFPARKIGGIWESDTELADAWRREQISPSQSPQNSPGKKTSRTGKTTKKTGSGDSKTALRQNPVNPKNP